MIQYLESYAKQFDLRPQFGETVRSVRRDTNTWVITSTSGCIRAPFVVIASGYNAEPITPSFVGMEKFEGKVLHSADYVDATSFEGQSVLVVERAIPARRSGLIWRKAARGPLFRCAAEFTLFRVSFPAFQFRSWECSLQACFPQL